MRRVTRAIGALALLAGLLALLSSPAASAVNAVDPGEAVDPGSIDGAHVVAIDIDGVITPAMADHLESAVQRAVGQDAQAVVVTLDTPGGQLETTRRMVDDILGADVPIVFHVAPTGARAGSAGTFLTYAAHVAAMASGTTIGAATPVDGEGEEVLDKFVEDSASYLEAIAEERDRDPGFAVEAVREGTSITADEAEERGAIDQLAETREELLEAIDGREVVLGDGSEVTLETADATVDEVELGFARQILQAIANPDLAFIFLSIGTLAIIYEFANPGAGIGGAIGAVMLILAFYSLSVLPTTFAGLALLALAGGLLIAELFAPGVGALAGGGSIALLVAGLLLFDEAGGLGISWWVLFPTVALAGLGALALGILAARQRSRPSTSTGPGRLIGREAEVRVVEEDGRVHVFADGTYWNARSAEPLKPQQRVIITDVDGLVLEVTPADGQQPHDRPSSTTP